GLGRRAERALNSARTEIAGILGCRENEIIFTSGGTESNNLAIIGFAQAYKRQSPKIYAQPWEHPSILEAVRFAKEQGLAETQISSSLEIESSGITLVSLSQVSHETGDINDITELAAAIKKQNPEAIIHVDGVQGFCKEPTKLTNIDLYSFSGHKIHGAAGVGGLVVRSGIRLTPLLHGGNQEFSLRAGTENLAGILQTTTAAKILYDTREKNYTHAAAIKAELSTLTEILPDCHLNARTNTVSPYILNLSFDGIKGETLVHLLSEKGIYVSMGAACRSRKKTTSILETMGFTPERAQSAVRFSSSHLNTIEEAAKVKEIIVSSVEQMRRVLKR
ncbi:MAG: aminotransferase class V-fold PLP-dependent enzyme, partial [Defluviitaleaceae bacterium]|nr:aminotransferase class V-fold PLP-dependent enzyme [Defluviitaleaceae bacterium]